MGKVATTPRPPSAHVDDQAAARIAAELKATAHWVVWKWTWKPKKNKGRGGWDKPPINPRTGLPTDATDETAWMTFDEARALARQLGDGIGFALGKADRQDAPYTGIDLDKVIDEDGKVAEWAQAIVDRLASHTYVTPSRRGLRVIVRGRLPRNDKGETRCKIKDRPDLEFYDADRYFTFTGDVIGPTETIEDRAAELAKLHAETFPAWTRLGKPKDKAKTKAESPASPIFPTVASASGIPGGELLSDDDLVRLAMQAKNGAKFTALWAGNVDGPSHSEADQALCNLLAFYVGPDPGRIDRIFRRSGLFREDKWAVRQDYRERTIARALEGRTEFWKHPTETVLKDGVITWRFADPFARKARPAASANGDGKQTANGKAVGEGTIKVFANFAHRKVDKGEGKTEDARVAIRMPDLARSLGGIAGGWPKRVEEDLFLHHADHRPTYLDSSTRLFAWIDAIAQVDWTKGPRFITQERLYEHLRMNVERFESIETLPHWPALAGSYYMHRPVGRGRGEHLDGFLDFFCPETDADRELIRAMVMTPFWGGSPGSRPAWLVTGPEIDREQGRGLGKTALADIIAEEIMGGSLDVSPNEDMESIKTRLLSDNGRQARIVRLDNVKTLRFSWGDLEKMITSPKISGRRLYKGEGRRPNFLVWFITLNGASLSKDMAQRVIPIRLRRPKFKSSWEKETRAFARDHRWEIIADVRARLEDERGIMTPQTRWAAWEAEVLAQTDDLLGCQAIIAERQATIDDDTGEKETVAAFFAERLRFHDHVPETASVLLPSVKVAEWLSEATRRNYATNAASTYLGGLGIPQLSRARKTTFRGWLWRGSEANHACDPCELRESFSKVTAKGNSKEDGSY